MPAEWQRRQASLIASATAPPGKVRSLAGRLMLTERSVTPPPVAIEGPGATGGASAAEVACAEVGGAARADRRAHPAGVASTRRITPTAETAPPAIASADLAVDVLLSLPGSSDRELNALDHVAHEATRVPVRLGRLDL